VDMRQYEVPITLTVLEWVTISLCLTLVDTENAFLARRIHKELGDYFDRAGEFPDDWED
jgi:hypothetical protein